MSVNWREMRELALSDDADLVIDASGDLAVASAGQALAEQIMVRLRTYPGDGQAMPGVGCPLEDFIGQPNTRETGEALETAVKDALTRDGFLTASEVEVTVVPVGETRLLIVIEPLTPTGQSLGSLDVEFDLFDGALG